MRQLATQGGSCKCKRLRAYLSSQLSSLLLLPLFDQIKGWPGGQVASRPPSDRFPALALSSSFSRLPEQHTRRSTVDGQRSQQAELAFGRLSSRENLLICRSRIGAIRDKKLELTLLAGLPCHWLHCNRNCNFHYLC